MEAGTRGCRTRPNRKSAVSIFIMREVSPGADRGRTRRDGHQTLSGRCGPSGAGAPDGGIGRLEFQLGFGLEGVDAGGDASLVVEFLRGALTASEGRSVLNPALQLGG